MAKVQKRSSTSSDNGHSFQESSSQSYKVGARSCKACHQRKVRCDRGVPCANCSKYGFTCVYPSGLNDVVTRKSPTLQDISNRLERLETLLSRFCDNSQVTKESFDGGNGGGESQTQSQIRPSVNVDAIQHPPNQHIRKSTWDLLLNEQQVAQYANSSNVKILQHVSLDFLVSRGLLIPFIEVSESS